ncbi:acyl-CoA reductase [Treponema parvum]|uniref:Acyl-CoA reductase n=1 Tax=Treponema parvum TaxID=138851 RepID=A0A975IBZ3_9SPIR|nr:acyl-CoA reductase [Treponema parvum]QTQ11293.1 acyl-CoA reductase [Treponema parvum]QTQ16767.1 acyl-CoA reductase [Treponema parvum]
MDFLTEKLLQNTPFSYNENEKKKGGSFYNAVKEELCFHYDNNPLYKRFCDNKKFNPHDFSGSLVDIPPVHVAVFKELGKTLGSVPKEEIKLTLQSSATSGVPSSVPIDKVTSKRQSKAMVKVVGDFIGNERKPFLVMDIDPMSGFRDILGARFAAVSGYLNFASKVGYFLKVNENNQYYFDTEGIKKYIKELDLNTPAVIFGFTYILYSEVVKPLTENGVKFVLPKGSKIIHIGGWKKLESEKVSKEEFNAKASGLFGIGQSDVIDIYGFTEQMGLNYPDCKCGCKHVPLFSEVIVRDIVSKEPLPAGKEGLLEFITPIPHSYPGNAVLTDDIGIIESGECPYGRSGTRFRMLGRLKKAEVRGCGDILSSKLKFIDEKISVSSSETGIFNIEFFSGNVDTSFEPKEQLESIISALKKSLSWLRKQPVDALIGLIGQVSKKWGASNNPDMVALRERGTGFLSSWCNPEHLTKIATEGLHGNRMYADTFLPVDDSKVQYMKATSKGLVCHWLAGNVQVLGMFALVESIITKNVNLLKVSSKDKGVFTSLLKAFEGEVFTTKGGCTIKGDDLLKTVALVYFDHGNDELGKIMSLNADARISWGGKDAVMTVAGYPSRFDCDDIIMGPKLSFSVVAKEKLDDDHAVKKLARKIAVDASVFDQTGCASTHNIFVESGGKISPEQFIDYLAEGMKKAAVQIPKAEMSPEQISSIHSVRGIYDFKGRVVGSNDSTWTVLYSEDSNLCAPVYSRVLFVHPVENINEALPYVDDNIQTIGMAAHGRKALDFAIKAAEKGAMRFPDCGKMLNFESPWDGMFIMERLVKWNTLGGPLV